ncbi:MAG: cytochrome c [Chloroflexi bacterium]|nr:cytochrome c [Chloroflexota bacterium]
MIRTSLKDMKKVTFHLKGAVEKDKITYLIFTSVILLAASIMFSGIFAGAATPSEDGKEIFKQKCQACHTIGGGRGIGPDLKEVTAIRDSAWLISFITAPDKLIAQGDPIAKELVQQYGLPMPNLGVSENDAKAILAYLDAQSTARAIAPPQSATEAPSVSTTALPASAATGRDLYTGAIALTNGGPACISCHNIRGVGIIGGGTVGKDLTDAYANLDEEAIHAILRATPFPMMKEIFSAKPLTTEEIANLSAFLEETSNAPSPSSQTPWTFIGIGVAGAIVIIGIFQLLWRGRLSGVRRSLVKGGSR